MIGSAGVKQNLTSVNGVGGVLDSVTRIVGFFGTVSMVEHALEGAMTHELSSLDSVAGGIGGTVAILEGANKLMEAKTRNDVINGAAKITRGFGTLAVAALGITGLPAIIPIAGGLLADMLTYESKPSETPS